MKKLQFAMSLSLICLAFVSICHATPTKFAWDASAGPVQGYKLYYGSTSRNYTVVKDVGNQTTYTVDLPEDKVNYVAATAYDANGNESDYSNEVICYTIKVQPGLHGVIGKNTSYVIEKGGNVIIAIVPDQGFTIKDVLIDANRVGPLASYTFTDIQANHSIGAEFAEFVLSPIQHLRVIP
jgi:hypothetical protein